MLEAPAKFYARYAEGIEGHKTKAMVDGEILHEWTLRPEEFEKRVVIHRFKDFRTKAAQDWRESQPANALVMSEFQRDEYRKIVDRVWENSLARSLLDKARKEHHGYAKDPVTGLWLYSRPDFITTDALIGELKFVESSDYDDFLRQQFFERWYMQGGFYNMVDGLIRGEHREQNFFYIAVEKAYPHIVEVYPLGIQYEVMAERKIRKGIDLIAHYMKEDPAMANRLAWPGYVGKAKELKPTYGHLTSDPDFNDLIEIGG